MKCRKVAKELPAYIANELSERARSRIEKHLKHCVPCRAELGALKRTDQLLDTLADVEPRRDLVGLVMRQIEREQETIPAFKRFLLILRERRPQLQYAAVNVLLVVLLAFGIYHYQGWRARQAQRHQAALLGGSGTPTVTGVNGVSRPGTLWMPKRFLLFRWKPATPAIAQEDDIRIPLSETGIEQLNSELELAKMGQAASESGDHGLSPPSSEVTPVSAPFVFLRPGPGGTLIIEPGPEEPTQPAE